MKKGASYSFAKKTFRFLLLATALIFFLSQSGFIIFKIGRNVCYHYLKHYRSEKINDTLLISLNDAAIVWHKKDEISYRGKMFDIKEQIQLGEKLMFIGHYDEREDELFDFLKKLLRTEKKNKGKGTISIWTFDATIPGAIIPAKAMEQTSLHVLPFVSKFISEYRTDHFHPPKNTPVFL